VLSWQAGYDSKLLRQAEPKMVKKAKEIRLGVDIKAAMEERSRSKLHECMTLANNLGLTQGNFPILVQAYALNEELDAEVRKAQAEARPSHTKLMSSVIKEFSVNAFGEDIEKLQTDVENEAVSAKNHIDSNVARLQDCLSILESVKSSVASSEKLKVLQELHSTFLEINPRNLEDNVKTLSEQVEDLRADNAELMLSLRSGGTQIVTLSASSGVVPLNGHTSEEEIEQLRARIQELEENEEVLTERVQASAKLGAKWMEDKKNREIEEIIENHKAQLAASKGGDEKALRAAMEKEMKDFEKNEKTRRVQMLEGLEDTLKKQHTKEKDALVNAHKREMAEMQAKLENADKRVKQFEKALKLMGVQEKP
jgi:hypothetical protein